jgi:hypothetical protein
MRKSSAVSITQSDECPYANGQSPLDAFPPWGPAADRSPGLMRRWAMREMGAVSMRLRPAGVSSGRPTMARNDSACRRDEQVRCSWW